MNKKAQVGMSIFTILFIILIFIIVFSGALAPFIQTLVPIAINNGSLTGIEAFLVANLGLWVLLVFVVAIMWWTRI